MSTSNRISIEIPNDVIEKATENVSNAVKILAPFLQGLSNDERRDLFKMGDKTYPTVQKIKSYLDTNPEFAPNYMQVEEFKKDEALVSVLLPLLNIARQLTTNIDDTCMLAGSEAISEGMFYYGSVRDAANKGIPAAKPIYEDLKQRFAKKSKRKTE